MRDITQLSFAINPDHIAYIVQLKDDRTPAGVASGIAEGKLHIGDKDGRTPLLINRRSRNACPLPLSCQTICSRNFRRSNLATCSVSADARTAHEDYVGGEKRPKPRTIAEVNAILAGGQTHPKRHGDSRGTGCRHEGLLTR